MSSTKKVLHNNPIKHGPTSNPHSTPEELRTSEIRYRRLFEAARDGILILDASTLQITDVNPFMTELLGYTHEEFSGKELWEIGLFKDKEASQAAFQELQKTGYMRHEDLPLVTMKGEVKQVEFVSNVYDEDSKQVIQCNIRDITERKRAEQEHQLLFESAQTAYADAHIASGIKDEFLATLSHELRTPLTAILGWSNMLATENLDEPAAKNAVDVIVRNARAQRQLIDDLLDISRIITGKLRLNVRPVETAPMIEAVIEGLVPAADAKNIDLHSLIDPELSPINGDPDRLQQIIWNLVSNAIKFTPKGGSVQVRLQRVASQIEITVKDSGQGIDPALLPNVFDRFLQADSSTTRAHGGLGLGLSIVRELVELHGGTVSAHSPGIGEGATFRVLLPLLSVHHQRAEVEIVTPLDLNTTTHEPLLSDVRVLVVDDEPDALKLVSAVLTTRGAEVVSVGSADEAMEEMEKHHFDVLVSDIGMPETDGYQLISNVRKLSPERGGRIPAAALTAYAGVEHRIKVLSAGYQMHIPKPVEPAELATVVVSLAARFP
jgi:PAS domain S-box-containing protein